MPDGRDPRQYFAMLVITSVLLFVTVFINSCNRNSDISITDTATYGYSGQ